MNTTYHWINNIHSNNKVLMNKDKTTGLLTIPGCEATTDQPQGREVMFQGKGYHTYAISPFGAIVLGNKGTYSQDLTREKLLPDTDNPVLCPFAEYLQVMA